MGCWCRVLQADGAADGQGMILKIDWPDASLWPNRAAGKHWTAKHKAKVAAREAGYYAALKRRFESSKNPPNFPGEAIPLSLVFCASNARRYDLDGALSACKPMLDGIAQALGIDDSRFDPVVLNRGAVGKPGCVIVGIGVQVSLAIDL
jgi:hypothetical protein